MKSFKPSFGPALGRQADVTNRLFDSVDRMAEALRPAQRDAQAPANHGHRHPEGQHAAQAAQAAQGQRKPHSEHPSDHPAAHTAAHPGHERAADRLRAAPSEQNAEEAAFLPEMAYDGVLLEVDIDSGCGHMGLRGTESGRVPILISDPLLRTPGNVYLSALAQMQPLHFLARASVDRFGEISRLYVSGLAQATAVAGEMPRPQPRSERAAEADGSADRGASRPRHAQRG